MAPSKAGKARRPLALMVLLLAGAMTLSGCVYYDYPSYGRGYYGERYHGGHYRRPYHGRDYYRGDYRRDRYRGGPYHH
jgi:hypothetical protein